VADELSAADCERKSSRWLRLLVVIVLLTLLIGVAVAYLRTRPSAAERRMMGQWVHTGDGRRILWEVRENRSFTTWEINSSGQRLGVSMEGDWRLTGNQLKLNQHRLSATILDHLVGQGYVETLTFMVRKVSDEQLTIAYPNGDVVEWRRPD
jgi:hypothetical protein